MCSFVLAMVLKSVDAIKLVARFGGGYRSESEARPADEIRAARRSVDSIGRQRERERERSNESTTEAEERNCDEEAFRFFFFFFVAVEAGAVAISAGSNAERRASGFNYFTRPAHMIHLRVHA